MRLTVADLAGVAAFYTRVVGLRTIGARDDDGIVRLGAGDAAPDGAALVELVGDPAAPPRARRSSGLFHLALLLPERAGLAQALRRVVGAGWRVDGAADHLVSEALYLSDPEGNGIELCADRPRETWRRSGDGEPAMATLPLDLEALLAADPSPGDDAGVPAGTRIGHVHLQVADLEAAEDFYAVGLGFEPTVRSYPGALFVARGGYHHHLGLNTWASAGGPPHDPAARGLRELTVLVPGRDAQTAVAARMVAHGYDVRDEGPAGAIVTDPFGIAVRLLSPAARR